MRAVRIRPGVLSGLCGEYSLILFLVVWKVFRFYIVDILTDSAGDLLVEVEIAAEEAGLELGGDAEQIVHDEHLAIAVFAGADADSGDVEALSNLFGEGGGDLFEDHAGAAGFFQQTGVFFEFFGFLFFAGANGIGPEFVDVGFSEGGTRELDVCSNSIRRHVKALFLSSSETPCSGFGSMGTPSGIRIS